MSSLGCVRRRDSEQARGSGSLRGQQGSALNVLIVLPAEPAWKTLNYEPELPPTARKSHPSSFCPGSRDGGWHSGSFLGFFAFADNQILRAVLLFLRAKGGEKKNFQLICDSEGQALSFSEFPCEWLCAHPLGGLDFSL